MQLKHLSLLILTLGLALSYLLHQKSKEAKKMEENPLPSPEENKPGYKNGPANQQETVTASKQPESHLPHSLPQRPSPDEENWRAEQRQNWRRQLWPQWAMVFVTSGAVFAAIVTLSVLNETLEATKKAANASANATQVANDSLVIENRPWLFFEVRNFRLLEKVDIREQFVIQNQGKTPALGIDGCVTFEVLDINIPPSFGNRPCEKVEISMLRPASEEIVNLRVYKRESKPAGYVIPNRQTALAVQAGKMYVTAHGRLTFKDVFGINRWVTFCHSLYNGPPMIGVPIQPLQVCAQYNKMDNYTRNDQSEDQP